jgi:succinyl-diaminopimelate desuccinylase
MGTQPSVSPLASMSEADEHDVALTLSRLVATPSVNGVDDEGRMAEQVALELASTGCEIEFVEIATDRPSVASVLHGTVGEPRLVLNGHMDTVPPGDLGDWTRDPFGGEIEDGVVWGRGAADMKGGLTAQIVCARLLAGLRDRLRGTLIMHFAAGEESGEPGTRILIERGFTGDWGICTEPTGLSVALVQRGMTTLVVRVHGRPAHAALAESALNPIELLQPLLAALERHNDELQKTGAHPLLGPPRCAPTMIRCGIDPATIPAACELWIDRRLNPGEDPETAFAGLREALKPVVSHDRRFRLDFELIEYEPPFRPVETPEDSALVACVQRAATAVTGRPTPISATPYASDVRNLILDAGMEAITFGPGEFEHMHVTDEQISVKQVRDAALTLATTAVELLS